MGCSVKVWRCNKYDSGLGSVLSWHGSRREAQAALSEFQRRREGESVGPENVALVNIPTDKPGLLRWLNRNFESDNG